MILSTGSSPFDVRRLPIDSLAPDPIAIQSSTSITEASELMKNSLSSKANKYEESNPSNRLSFSS